MGKYKIYHVFGIKIGCTCRWPNRIKEQGFKIENCELLEQHDDIKVATKREQELQKEYGYRIDSFYIGERSEEVKQKISKSHIGKVVSFEHKASIAVSLRGKTLSEDRKKNLSETKKGKPFSGTHYFELTNSSGMKDKHHDTEAKKKISEGMKAVWEKRRQNKVS